MNTHEVDQYTLRLAEAVRAACLAAALESYEDASMRGLCHEGAWECAIGAIRSLNVRSLVAHYQGNTPPICEQKTKPHGERSQDTPVAVDRAGS